MYLCMPINLPYGKAWNTVVMSGLVLLVATWNCLTSYRQIFAGLLVLPLLPFLNSWLIVEMQLAEVLSVAIPYSCGRSTHYSNR